MDLVSRAPSASCLLSAILLSAALLSAACTGSQPTDWSGVQISGRLIDTLGGPVSGAHVYAYQLPDSDPRTRNSTAIQRNTMGPADAMSEPSADDGSYQLVVPVGTYVITARKRISGSISGPLRNGDLVGQIPEPVKAVPGGASETLITLSIFRQGVEGDPKRILITDTRIEGRVVDRSGKPVAGAHVFAFEGRFSSDIPDYMAETTDKNGLFRISLPGGGSFAIGARTGLRGKPRPDDYIGFWGGKDVPQVVEEGSVTKGVIIVVVPYGESTTERPGN